ncbi:MAG: hypothetical protein K0R94_158 [Burkholderiales bacterium]|jgi:hypothetical protein|nr:hypothetical protein [Burkholderiales bacterium]
MKNLYQSFIIALFSFLLFSCNSSTENPGSTNNNPPPQTLAIPLSYTLNGESTSLNMPLNIGYNPLYVSVDTGSVGLRVLESSLTNMQDITITNIAESYTYANGVLISGVVANAPVNIGGVIIQINFMLIQNVSCILDMPDCPLNSFNPTGIAGVMGINLDAAGTSGGIWSPLGQLPGNLANGFIVVGYTSSPSLIIGLTPDNTTGFNYINLSPIAKPASNPDLYNLWNTQLTGGISFPQPNTASNLTVQIESGLILYDSKATSLTVYNLPNHESGIFAAKGGINIYHTLATGNNLNWSIITGNTPAVKSSETSVLMVNTGNAPFTQMDILYNIESGLMGFRQHQALSAKTQTQQMVFSDSYSCMLLPICNANESASLSCVTNEAYQRCTQLQSLAQSGVSLNDSNNLYISMFQKQKFITDIIWPTWMNTNLPTTLFASFTMVYSPDPSAINNQIGWPVNDLALQQQAFNANSGGTCLPLTNNNVKSFSPWLSHCSAFTQWAESTVFNVQVPPAQPQPGFGYDWCGLADKNNAGLIAGNNGWRNVDTYSTAQSPVTAQILANQGCAVVVNYYNNTGAGHIAVVLPSTWQAAAALQNSSNYPLNVLVKDSSTFEGLLNQVGPEEMQAGLFNFQHTVVFNGFFSELVTPQDYSKLMYFYNPVSCPK